MNFKVFAITTLIIAVLVTGCTTNSQPQTPVITPIPTVSPTDPAKEPSPVQTTDPVKPNVTPGIDSIIHDSLKKLSPIFSAYYDDIQIKDYKKLASDNLLLKKEVEEQQELFGKSMYDSNIPNAKNFTSADKFLFTKYIGYLDTLNKMVTSTSKSLEYINDDNSKMTAEDKKNMMMDSDFARNDGYKKIKLMFDTCSNYEGKCGMEDPEIDILITKPLIS